MTRWCNAHLIPSRAAHTAVRTTTTTPYTYNAAPNARQYNESAMLLTLQSILASARQPPPHFQKLAQAHYRQTRERLLQRCRLKLAEAQAQAQETVSGGSVEQL